MPGKASSWLVVSEARLSNLMYSSQPWPTVKIGIEAHQRSNAVAFHNSNVERVPSGQGSEVLHDPSGAQNIDFLDSEYLVDNLQHQLEGDWNCISPANGSVPMEDFLQDPGIRRQAFSCSDRLLNKNLRFRLSLMWSTHQIHGDVRVD